MKIDSFRHGLIQTGRSEPYTHQGGLFLLFSVLASLLHSWVGSCSIVVPGDFTFTISHFYTPAELKHFLINNSSKSLTPAPSDQLGQFVNRSDLPSLEISGHS